MKREKVIPSQPSCSIPLLLQFQTLSDFNYMTDTEPTQLFLKSQLTETVRNNKMIVAISSL